MAPDDRYNECRLNHSKERSSNSSLAQPPSFPKINIVFSPSPELEALTQAEELIQEFLAKQGLFNTLTEFRREIGLKPIASHSMDFKEVLLASFEQNNGKVFFEYWTKFVPMGKRIREIETVKLELLLRIFFLTSKFRSTNTNSRSKLEPIVKQQNVNRFRIIRRTNEKSLLDSGLRDSGPTSKATATLVIESLRMVLEPNGEQLTKIQELLPFYGLLYIKEPQLHPIYQEIFSPEWRESIKQRLIDYLDGLFEGELPPRLLMLTKNLKTNSLSRTSLCQSSKEGTYLKATNTQSLTGDRSENIFFQKNTSAQKEDLDGDSVDPKLQKNKKSVNTNDDLIEEDQHILDFCKDILLSGNTGRREALQAIAAKATELANQQSRTFPDSRETTQPVKSSSNSVIDDFPLTSVFNSFLIRDLHSFGFHQDQERAPT